MRSSFRTVRPMTVIRPLAAAADAEAEERSTPTLLPRAKTANSAAHSPVLFVLRSVMKRTALALFLLACAVPAQQRSVPSQTIDDFFRSFTDEWVRGNPDLASSTRYFTG